MKTYQIDIKGIVQGVGFRPFIYNLANSFDLKGFVLNNSFGVQIKINTNQEVLDKFIEKINLSKPPLSQINSIDCRIVEYEDFDEFKILQTKTFGSSFTIIPADISICDDCKKELNDKNSRRYRYPFINCTNCGPRYTIINTLPYDRPNTSMKNFQMCKACQDEYTNPTNRRYHAQPISCFECGPKLELFDKNGNLNLSQKEIINKSVELIKDGKIVAIKGIGGYHLVCDATNDQAIQNLRDRKNRPHKPFAIMTKDIQSAKNLAYINDKESQILESIQRPIVLLKSKENKIISQNIAPNINKIGIFLPYTPLHELILNQLDFPLVATSANISGQPMAINKESILQLSNIWDYCLDHNREILNSCDDSVLAVVDNKTLFFRQARGYAPKSIKSPITFDNPTLALGANQKSTIAIGFEDDIILSSHIGDLGSLDMNNYFEENINNFKRIYNIEPKNIVCDLHDNYESSKYAKKLKDKNNDINLVKVQHHYAHILSVMVEKNINQKVLGVSFDGTGFGDDGTLWGGEFLICDFNSYQRVASLKPFRLLGATKAIKEPRRVALSFMFDIYGKYAVNINNTTINSFSSYELNTLFLSHQKGLNSPLSSSFGRVFDAVASLLDIIQVISYEGQSGAMLEAFYDENIDELYDWTFEDKIININIVIKQIIEDKSSKEIIVSKFFNTVVDIICTIYQDYDLPIVLSGGVFQNISILKKVLQKIPKALFNNTVPINDGGISLGQIVKGV
jgi:hydrogenase maturation protein HypF